MTHILFVCHSHCRYHPACVGMTIEEAKKLEHFVCSECSSDDEVKRSQNGFASSPTADVKVSLVAGFTLLDHICFVYFFPFGLFFWTVCWHFTRINE